MTEYLKINVKQGEELDIPFTIKENDNVMDLTGRKVRFQVKKVPLVDKEPIVDKLITEDSDEFEVGIINSPTTGQFKVHLKKDDTSYPVGEYALIVAFEDDNYFDIISSSCCNKAVYKICEQ